MNNFNAAHSRVGRGPTTQKKSMVHLEPWGSTPTVPPTAAANITSYALDALSIGRYDQSFGRLSSNHKSPSDRRPLARRLCANYIGRHPAAHHPTCCAVISFYRHESTGTHQRQMLHHSTGWPPKIESRYRSINTGCGQKINPWNILQFSQQILGNSKRNFTHKLSHPMYTWYLIRIIIFSLQCFEIISTADIRRICLPHLAHEAQWRHLHSTPPCWRYY